MNEPEIRAGNDEATVTAFLDWIEDEMDTRSERYSGSQIDWFVKIRETVEKQRRVTQAQVDALLNIRRTSYGHRG